MKRLIKGLSEYVILFLVYAAIYFMIETVWKGQPADYRMFILGGALGVLIGLLNNIFTYDTDLLLQGYAGMITVCLAEAVFGYQWNVLQGLGIWDYTELPFSAVAGQVNLFFAAAWFFLSVICIFLDDFIWYRLFGHERPYYRILGKRFELYGRRRRKK